VVGEGGNVVRDDDDGVEFIHVGNLLDQFAGFIQHEQVQTAEGFVDQKEVVRAQDLLDEAALALFSMGDSIAPRADWGNV
jgi:hypothetical protein